MALFRSVSETVGNTPLVRLANFEKELQLNCKLYGKLECFNPAGSAKDRVALSMICDAEEKGFLKPGGTIVEPTSGNTGIGLASCGVPRGYKVILTMPDSMSVERIALLKAYGAEVILTPGALGMQGAIDKATEIVANTEGAFMAGQFTNPANVKAHYEGTGPEIYRDLPETDIFIAGVGTGGTLSGVGKFLKEQNKNIKVLAVEPADSPLLSGGKAGPHKIQGIGANFIPEILDRDVYDEVIAVPHENAYEMGNLLAKKEGILVGISAGAALFAASLVAKRPENKDKSIVVLLPDSGERYMSTPLFGN